MDAGTIGGGLAAENSGCARAESTERERHQISAEQSGEQGVRLQP